jgi:hypothetical protein
VLASEGSFGAHPIMGFIAANEEVLLLCDYTNGFEIKTKVISTKTNFSGQAFEKWEDVLSYAERVHFPSHGLIVRPSNGAISEVHKGICSWEQLEQSFYYFHRSWGSAFVETDMRAHYNPTRMAIIHEAASQLLKVLMNSCPICEGPGFEVKDVIRGLPCGLCNKPTKAAKAHVYYCQHCKHEETINSSNETIYEDPMFCDVCNP